MKSTMHHARSVVETCRRLASALPSRPSRTRIETLRPCALELESRLVTDPVLLEQTLAGFGAHSGWLERQSRVALILDGHWPAAENGYDAVIDGELAKSDAGLEIRRLPDGWRLTRIADRSDDEGHYLAHEVLIPGVDSLPTTGMLLGRELRYRVYWKHSGTPGWQQCAARFLGFGTES